MATLQRGKYLTANNIEARVYDVYADYHAVIAWVKSIGLVAYNFDGTVAYEHIPQELTIKLDTWQALPENQPKTLEIQRRDASGNWQTIQTVEVTLEEGYK